MIRTEHYHKTVAYRLEAQFEVRPLVYYERREIGVFVSYDLAQKVKRVMEERFWFRESPDLSPGHDFEGRRCRIEEVAIWSLDEPEQALSEDPSPAVEARFVALTREFLDMTRKLDESRSRTEASDVVQKCDDQIALEETYGFLPKSFATQKSLRRAYLAWCLKNHPDKKPKKKKVSATLLFQTVKNHYDLVMKRLK